MEHSTTSSHKQRGMQQGDSNYAFCQSIEDKNIHKWHKVARIIGSKLQQINERKLSLAVTNNGFTYQDTAHRIVGRYMG